VKEVVKLHMVCISSNNDRQPVPKTFTPLHYTSLYLSTLHFFPFKLYLSTLHYKVKWFNILLLMLLVC